MFCSRNSHRKRLTYLVSSGLFLKIENKQKRIKFNPHPNSDTFSPLTVDARETPDNDSSPTKMSRFQGRVLSAAAFAIVLVTNDNPVNALSLQRFEVK